MYLLDPLLFIIFFIGVEAIDDLVEAVNISSLDLHYVKLDIPLTKKKKHLWSFLFICFHALSGNCVVAMLAFELWYRMHGMETCM